MESMYDALMRRMEHFGLAQSITATTIIEAANRILPAEAKAQTFRNGSLVVEVTTSAEAYLLKQEQDTYKERINAALGEAKVTTLYLRIAHR